MTFDDLQTRKRDINARARVQLLERPESSWRKQCLRRVDARDARLDVELGQRDALIPLLPRRPLADLLGTSHEA